MDLRMPVMNGVVATRRIRALEGGREVKIAAVTASGFSSERGEVLAAGLDDYVRKPYRPQEIFECMARHLGLRYRQDETEPAAGEPDAGPRPEALAALPEELGKELRKALIALDVERISRAIGRVAEADAALGSALARLARQFAYTALLNAVEACKEESARRVHDGQPLS
jgi:CheY-like chemotaxis protein